ncbi:MAG: hypothetical protein IKE55_12180 [Kiritimatiellae bacterium]|nr:hypothetical protein [Kiritimatiellia bacterium]
MERNAGNKGDGPSAEAAVGRAMKRLAVRAVAALALGLCGAGAHAQSDGVIAFETETFRLEVGTNAVARSLVVKATGEETIDSRDGLAMFSVTQDRPFNNEIKLMCPNKRTTYPANRVRRDGDRLSSASRRPPTRRSCA